MNFGFKLFLFVREQIEFNIRVGAASHIHGRKVCSLQDANYQLACDDSRLKEENEQLVNCYKKKSNGLFGYGRCWRINTSLCTAASHRVVCEVVV